MYLKEKTTEVYQASGVYFDQFRNIYKDNGYIRIYKR